MILAHIYFIFFLIFFPSFIFDIGCGGRDRIIKEHVVSLIMCPENNFVFFNLPFPKYDLITIYLRNIGFPESDINVYKPKNK